MPQAAAELFDLVNDRLRLVAYDFATSFTRVLTLARQVTDGDLDRALIMAAITIRTSNHPDYRQATPLEGDVLPGFGTNVQSLADSTGIPRETVRRKVQQLVGAGWVIRKGRTLHYSVEGYQAISPVRAELIRMFVQGYVSISALVASEAAPQE